MARIAVIDDNVDIGEALGLVLLGCHEVAVFSDGLSFLERFGTNLFDVVVVDLLMPDMDGFQVLAKIRQSSTIPVIAVSAYEPQMLPPGLRKNFSEFLRKPMRELGTFRSIVLSYADAADAGGLSKSA